MTPPRQFRDSSSTGPRDGMFMDVPAQTGIDWVEQERGLVKR